MDKAGSGLADASRMMLEFGGKAEFKISDGNQSTHVILRQAAQLLPGSSSVATPLVQPETFITNLLPISVIPAKISILPLRDRPMEDIPLFEPDERPSELPIFITHGDALLTFADLKNFPRFANKRGFVDKGERVDVGKFISNEDNRRLFVWLVGKHWEFYLKRFYGSGLTVEYKRKRAYFCLVSGDGNTIKYNSRLRQNVRREVVKKRIKGRKIEFENEGFAYNVVEFVGQWANHSTGTCSVRK